ncbi:hypothetical protein O181_104092 [Austropuccinia psidii MF-1]|uniref:Uncharacterized protein n=1 Tax=Austropuccinia psidii MF-1 TaxID=1389203 RepID=A0A9Q3JMD6_9BASI|nr:hypothetical protein [Austropuccinia psidii MF-1]
MVSSLPSQALNGTFLVIDSAKGEDLMLGFECINYFNPTIDWGQGLITFNPDHKDYLDNLNYFSNEFPSANKCAALVGDSRTQSFQASVHILACNSHQSLISSRDEVFKEIRDAEEYNSILSPHLFYGNVDLPPSSYHDSLDRFWNEEEEQE